MLLNVAIVGGTTFIGVNVRTVLEPLDLIGGTCSPLIVFILPASASHLLPAFSTPELTFATRLYR